MVQLRYYGDPVLRRRADEIEQIDDEVRELAALLLVAKDEHLGLGVAAPQIGFSRRMFVASLDNWDEDGSVLKGEAKIFINPKLSSPSEEHQGMDEGCLSIPDVRVPVERPLRITVEALDLDGQPFKLELEGLAATIVMHENDHLNGVLIVDRTTKQDRKRVEPELQAIKKRFRTNK